MLPDSILPTPESDIARQLTRLEKRVESLERLEGGGALTLIEDITLQVDTATIDFDSIPASYAHLLLIASLRSTVALTSTSLNLRLNGDAGSNYHYALTFIRGSGAVGAAASLSAAEIQVGFINAANSLANAFSPVTLVLPNYASADHNASVLAEVFLSQALGAVADLFRVMTGGGWRNTTPVNRVVLSPSAGSFASGSRASLYGLAS